MGDSPDIPKDSVDPLVLHSRIKVWITMALNTRHQVHEHMKLRFRRNVSVDGTCHILCRNFVPASMKPIASN